MTAPSKLVGGHPVLDFVNSLDNRFADGGPNERLVHYGDVLLLLRQTRLAAAAQIGPLADRQDSAAAGAVLTAVRDLREALADIFYGMLSKNSSPAVRQLKTIERQILDADQHRELTWQPQTGRSGMIPRAAWTWGRSAASLNLPLWLLAQSAVSLLTSEAIARVHMCDSPTCRWLFLDASKNHSRRWCDMKICGNRMKARRHHARQES